MNIVIISNKIWNLIISYFNRLHLKNNVEFSLYDLAINIFKKNVFNKLSNDLFIRTTILFKEISTKNIVNKVKHINNLNNEEDETNDNSYDEIDTEDESNEDNKDQKTFQKTVNWILDFNIDKENANAINHSAIKLDKIYRNKFNRRRKKHDKGEKGWNTVDSNFWKFRIFIKIRQREKFHKF